MQEDAPKPKVSHVCLLITSEFDCLNLRNLLCDMFMLDLVRDNLSAF